MLKIEIDENKLIETLEKEVKRLTIENDFLMNRISELETKRFPNTLNQGENKCLIILF